MKKIKSVKRNLIEYELFSEGVWKSKISTHYGYYEIIPEIVILNCPLFEVEYEPERWRAEEGQKYFYLSGFSFLIDWEYERGRSADLTRYDIGNYFKTKEQAQKFIDSLKPIFEKFHREEGNYERN